MYDDAYADLMEELDRKDDRAYRQRFLARMQHKLNAKERRFGRHRH